MGCPHGFFHLDYAQGEDTQWRDGEPCPYLVEHTERPRAGFYAPFACRARPATQAAMREHDTEHHYSRLAMNGWLRKARAR